MKRSRVTFATMEAAAMAADVASPSTMARCSKPKSATRAPADRHRGRGGRPAAAVDDGALLEAEVRDAEAVDQAHRPGLRHPAERVAQGGEVRAVQATLVDALRAAGDDADLERRPQHDGIERLAALRGVLLGVVERRPRAGVAGA